VTSDAVEGLETALDTRAESFAPLNTIDFRRTLATSTYLLSITCKLKRRGKSPSHVMRWEHLRGCLRSRGWPHGPEPRVRRVRSGSFAPGLSGGNPGPVAIGQALSHQWGKPRLHGGCWWITRPHRDRGWPSHNDRLAGISVGSRGTRLSSLRDLCQALHGEIFPGAQGVGRL